MDNKTFIDQLKRCKTNIQKLGCEIIKLDSEIAVALPISNEVDRTFVLKQVLTIFFPQKKVVTSVYKSLIRVFNLNRLSVLNRNGVYYIRAMDCSRICLNQEASCLLSASNVDSEKEDDPFSNMDYEKEQDLQFGFHYAEEGQVLSDINPADGYYFSQLGENLEVVTAAKLAETFEDVYQEDPSYNAGDDDGGKELQARLFLSGMFVQPKQPVDVTRFDFK